MVTDPGGRPHDHEVRRNGLVHEAFPPSLGHGLMPHFDQNLSPKCFALIACHSCSLCPQPLDQRPLALASAWGWDKEEKWIRPQRPPQLTAAVGPICSEDPILPTPARPDALLHSEPCIAFLAK